MTCWSTTPARTGEAHPHRQHHERPRGAMLGVPESTMAQAPYYHATLCLRAPLLVTKDEKRGEVKVAVAMGDTQLPIGVKRKLSTLLEEKPPEGGRGSSSGLAPTKRDCSGTAPSWRSTKMSVSLSVSRDYMHSVSSLRWIRRTRCYSCRSTRTKVKEL